MSTLRGTTRAPASVVLRRSSRPLSLLVVLAGLHLAACASPEVAGYDESGSAGQTSPEERGPGDPESDAAPSSLAPSSLLSCEAGAALTDEALLALAPQAGAAVVALTGSVRVTTRTCEADRCVSDLASDEPVAAVTFVRAIDGSGWRTQMSPSSALTLSLALDAKGALSGELARFGASPASASLEGTASTSCVGGRATASTEVAGKRLETTVSFRLDVPSPAPRTPVGEEPPSPECARFAAGASLISVLGTRVSTDTATVLEQWRDCRAVTGCKPWETAVVGKDGSSAWQRTGGASFEPLTSSASFRREDRGMVYARFASSNGASTARLGYGTTVTTPEPLLGRPGSVDIKVTEENVVYREAGGARPDPAQPGIRSLRYVCIPFPVPAP